MTRPARLAAVVEEATVDAAGPVRAVMATGAAAEPGWEPLAASKAVIAWLVSDIRRVVQARPPSDVDSKLRPFTLYQLLVTRVLGAAAPNRLPPGSAAAASVRSRPAERVWTAMFHAGRGGMTPRAGHKRVDYIQGARLMLLLPSAESVEVTDGPVEGATRVGASGGRMLVTRGGRTAAPVFGS